MTEEQQILLDLARSHTRLAGERLDETNVAFGRSHLNEALRALELLDDLGGSRGRSPHQAVIEVSTTKKHE
jgi:hypothetical protein